jgi:hypothetical protein
MLARTVSVLALLATAATASAAPSPLVRVTPLPAPGVPSTVRLGDRTAPTGTPVYSNTTNATGWYTSSPGTNEACDDLHLVSGGVLAGFDFGYNKSTSGTTAATVTFYAGDATDKAPTTVVAGPYVLSGLANGAQAYHVDVTDAKVIGKDVWMGIKYSTTSTGPFIYNPPTVGSSHDYWYQFQPTAGYSYFGGNPVANFYLGVYVNAATPVSPVTWGRIKGLFH